MNGDPQEGIPPMLPGEGARLGDFLLLRKLGEGGQAAVFLAHQDSLDREVALKLLLPGYVGTEVGYERLREEAKAASRVHHPGVAAVHGLGEAAGWHFLIQEYVDGKPLEDYVSSWRALGTRAADHYRTIAIWTAQVADAVGAAHEMGVIHRDIKLRNVLVDKNGTPRVIDFGQALGRDADRTAGSELVGTPAYMSPDQVLREIGEIDTRTDVFSLGSVLYEMLTTERAFKGTTGRQILDQVVLHDPPAPHMVVPGVPRDLSIICAKAMQKRRQDRYQTMAEFAEDLRRFLANRPILAQPPGIPRRAYKWTRRHPARALALLIAVAGVAGVTYFAIEASTGRARVKRVNDELEGAIGRITDAYQYLDPRTDSNAARILERTAREAIERAEDSPGARVRLLTLIGDIYLKWGLYTQAADVARAGVGIALAAYGPSDERTLGLQIVLAEALHELGQEGTEKAENLVEAENLLERVLATAERVLGRLHPVMLDAACALGQVCWTRGDAARAEDLLSRCYVGYRASPDFGEETWEATTAGNVLGRFLLSQGRIEDAEPLILEAYRFAKRASSRGPDDYATNYRIGSLGRLRRAQNRLDEAEQLYRESLQGLRSALGDEHHDTVASIRNLALLLGKMAKEQGMPERYEESVALLTEAYEISAARGDDPSETQRMLLSLANLLRQKGDSGIALQRFLELRELTIQDRTGKHWIEALYGAGRCLQSLGRPAEAMPYASEAAAAAEELSDPDEAAIRQRCRQLLGELKS